MARKKKNGEKRERRLVRCIVPALMLCLVGIFINVVGLNSLNHGLWILGLCLSTAGTVSLLGLGLLLKRMSIGRVFMILVLLAFCISMLMSVWNTRKLAATIETPREEVKGISL